MTENGFEVRYHDKFVRWRSKLKDRMAKLRIARRINCIVKKGHFGDQLFLGDDVWEVRIDCGPGYRLYYTKKGEQVIMLLCGGDKSSQAKDIKLAKNLAKETKNG